MGLTRHIWKVPYREVADMARQAVRDDADALFISCTNLPTYDVIPQLEAELRIPVISANQVTMWAALRRLGTRAVGPYQALINPAARSGPVLPGVDPGAVSAGRRAAAGRLDMTALGFLYPGHSAEDDYPRIEQLLGSDIRVDLVHTDIGEDAHRVDALLEMGSAGRLAAGVQELRHAGAEAVVWACTSGSFVYGWDGAHEQVRSLASDGRHAGLLDVLRLRARGTGARGAAGRDRRDVPRRRGAALRRVPAGGRRRGRRR